MSGQSSMMESVRKWVHYTRLSSRTGIGAIVVGVGLATSVKCSVWVFVLAVVLAVAGSAIRFWSAGIITKNRELATTGPYAYVRNPLYSGSFLIAAAFFILNGNPWFIVPVVIAGSVLYTRTILREEEDLLERFGIAYENYRALVPSVVPWRGRCFVVGGGETEFSFRQAMFNKEYNGMLGTLLMLGVFGLYLGGMTELRFRTVFGLIAFSYLALRGVWTGIREYRQVQHARDLLDNSTKNV